MDAASAMGREKNLVMSSMESFPLLVGGGSSDGGVASCEGTALDPLSGFSCSRRLWLKGSAPDVEYIIISS